MVLSLIFPKSLKIRKFRIFMEKTILAKRVRLGKKGQITIPKKIRAGKGWKEDDAFIVSEMAGEEIMIKKESEKKPEEVMLEIIRSLPKFDWRKAWKEVEEERKKERS